MTGSNDISAGHWRKIKSLTIVTKENHENGAPDVITFYPDTGKIEAFIDGNSAVVSTLDVCGMQHEAFDVLLELEDV